MTKTSQDADVIIIGSGIGGLTAGALLARLYGRRVLVLERHYRAGGFTHTFSRPGGFTWDVGVHYVGEVETPGTGRDLFEVVTDNSVRWRKMPETFERLVFPDFEHGIRAGREHFRADLIAAFPHEARGIDRYLAAVERARRYIDVLGVKGSAPAAIGAAVEFFARGRRRLALSTTRQVLDASITDPRLKAVLGARWGDYGLPPGESAFLAHAVVTDHYFEGGYYPEGSSARLAAGAIAVIEAAGGQVRTSTEVAGILVERGRAVGVRLAKGGELRARTVISDAGARNTYLRLLPDTVTVPFRDELASTAPGMASVTLYLGLSRSPEALGVRGENFWLHDGLDHDEMWSRRNRLALGEVSQAYLSFPSLKDPEARGHTAEIITGVDGAGFAPFAGSRWMRRGEDYAALKERIADAMLAVVERRLPGFGALVAHREVSTALTTAHFTAHPQGEIYGIPVTPARFTRPYLRPRTFVPGLFLTGADALMLGVAGAMRGGLVCVAALEGPGAFARLRRAASVPGRALRPALHAGPESVSR